MTAKMRRVMYRVETPWNGWIQTCYWTASYREATSNGNKIIDMELFPDDDMTDEQRALYESQIVKRIGKRSGQSFTISRGHKPSALFLSETHPVS